MSRFWTSQPVFSGKKRFEFRFLQAALAALYALSLAACSPQPGAHSSSGGSIQFGSGGSQTLAPLDSPPDLTARPPPSGQSGKGNFPNGLPALTPKGVKIEDLFSEDIKDPIERIKRVEGAVIEIRHDFDSVMPAIMRLVAVEGDMQNLVKQLDTLLPAQIAAAGPEVPALPATAVAATPLAPPLPGAFGPPAPASPNVVTAAAAPASVTPTLPPQTEGLAQNPSVPPRTEGLAPLQPLLQQAPQPQGTSPPQSQPPELVATAQPPPKQSPPQQAPPPEPVPTQQGPPPQTATPPPAPAQTEYRLAPPQQAPPAPAEPTHVPASGIPTAVTGVRLGEHGDTTRVVLDVSTRTSYHRDLDNEEKLLVIELPGADWRTSPTRAFADNPVIASYTTQSTDKGGTRLVVKLKAPVKVVYESTLDPDGTSGFRIVLDVKK